MNSARWKRSFLSSAARLAVKRVATSRTSLATAEKPSVAPLPRALDGSTGRSIPVFDRHQRRVGSVAAPAEWDNDAAGSSQRLLSHCLNASIRWLTNDVTDDVCDGLARCESLRRIPLKDAQDRLCGIVVLETITKASTAIGTMPKPPAHGLNQADR